MGKLERSLPNEVDIEMKITGYGKVEVECLWLERSKALSKLKLILVVLSMGALGVLE